jgi:hypothetical protein
MVVAGFVSARGLQAFKVTGGGRDKERETVLQPQDERRRQPSPEARDRQITINPRARAKKDFPASHAIAAFPLSVRLEWHTVG